MTYWKNFKPKACNIRLEAADQEPLLREIVETMVSAGALSKSLQDATIAALIERESQASTGVGMRVAIPHVQIHGLEQSVATLCVHPRGIGWNAVDGEDVHLFFTVLRPEKQGPLYDPVQHLEMMRWIARLGRSADFRSFALQAKTRTDLVDLLKEMAST
jgi:mannitol/fructose-specific phosphotransferase system IIA component (Ntr-type)